MPLLKRHKAFLLLSIFLLLCGNMMAQNVAINADSSLPDPNAMLDIKSFNKGLLIPRTSADSRIKIPATKGLLIYDTTTNSYWYNNGAAWNDLGLNTLAYVDDITQLQAYKGKATLLVVKDSLRGGIFNYYPSGLKADNGLVFAASGKDSGYWQRDYSQSQGILATWFGAIGDWNINANTGHDNRAAIQAAINSKPNRNTPVFFPKGIYGCSDSIILGEGTYLKGLGSLFPRQYVTATSYIDYDNMTALVFYNNTNGIVTSASETNTFRSQGIKIESLGVFGGGKAQRKTGIIFRQTTNSTPPLKTTGLITLSYCYINGWDTCVSGTGSADSWYITFNSFTNARVGLSGGKSQSYVIQNDFYNIESIAAILNGFSSPGDIFYGNEVEPKYPEVAAVLVNGSWSNIYANNFMVSKTCIRVANTAKYTNIHDNNFWENADNNIVIDSAEVVSINNNHFLYRIFPSSPNYDNVTINWNKSQSFIKARRAAGLSIIHNVFDNTDNQQYTGIPVVLDTCMLVNMALNQVYKSPFPDERAFALNNTTTYTPYDAGNRTINGTLTAGGLTINPPSFPAGSSSYKLLGIDTATGAVMKVSDITIKDMPVKQYVGIPSWSGTKPPSGNVKANYRWTQTGRKIDLNITLVYDTAGQNITIVTLPLPADVPAPAKPAGMESANSFLFSGTGGLSTSPTANVTPNNRIFLRTNSTGKGYYIYVLSTTAVNATTVYATITYWTN